MSTTYTRDAFGLLRALRALGRTDDEIAESLRARDHKGVPRVDNDCPLVAYLRAEFGADSDPCVEPGVVSLYGRCGAVQVWPPLAVMEFIESFDGRRYPDLIREPA